MQKYDIAAYVWPSYTGKELRARQFWPDGIGEWQTVMSVPSRMCRKPADYEWDRKPLWGCCDEADPKVMEMQINEATRHGVNVFIYDWYWYDRRPFLEGCLNDGFLKAKNNKKMQFYLMWANHNAGHLWNKELSHTDVANEPVWVGAVDEAEFRRMSRRIADKYFSIDNYYKIDGCPVFMIYEVGRLIEGMGSIEKTRLALEEFRAYVKSLGFPGLHLQFTGRGEDTLNMSGVDDGDNSGMLEILHRLGADSMTHYQFVHFTDIDRDYGEIMKDVRDEWAKIDQTYKMPYYPHVSCGWDNNPRYHTFRPGIVKNNTPEAFEAALRDAKDYIDSHPDRHPLITINSWNEWTETSYLEPDDLYGYGYLEAIKKVFKDGE